MICYLASFGKNSVFSSTNGKLSAGGSTSLKNSFPIRVINLHWLRSPDGTM